MSKLRPTGGLEALITALHCVSSHFRLLSHFMHKEPSRRAGKPLLACVIEETSLRPKEGNDLPRVTQWLNYMCNVGAPPSLLVPEALTGSASASSDGNWMPDLFIHSFIWLHQVLVETCGVFSCGIWSLI